MIPVYQTIIDPKIGNCLQAAIASLLDLSLEEVPNFITEKEGLSLSLGNFLLKRGYDFSGDAPKGHPVYDHLILGKKYDNTQMIFDGPFPGVNGYFIVSGPSPRFKGVSHAVIWNKWGLVHDPVPEARGVEPDSIRMIYKIGEWKLKKEYEHIHVHIKI